MLIAGVDLAAEPKGTALANVDWLDGRAKLVQLTLGASDEDIVNSTSSAVKLGIDCALGWPVEFVSFLNQHARMGLEQGSNSGDEPGETERTSTDFEGGIDWRRRLAFRESDRHVREKTGRWPLSVSTDRLGMTAMRAAGLLSKLQRAGIEIDRSGAGKVVEIYPGASLRGWGFNTAGYRNSPDLRATLLADLASQAPWLELTEFTDVMIGSCDAFDSVIAALAARAAWQGNYDSPRAEQLSAAKIEGWVALPNKPLASLL